MLIYVWREKLHTQNCFTKFLFKTFAKTFRYMVCYSHFYPIQYTSMSHGCDVIIGVLYAL